MELIINTFGVALSRENENFVVSQHGEKKSIPVSHVTSIQLSKGTQVTSDAIFLAIENEIDVLFVEKSGEMKGRIWSSQYGSISTIRKGQINFSFSGEAMIWIKGVITRKIENQQAMLLMLRIGAREHESVINTAVNKLNDYKTKIRGLEGELVTDIAPQLRGWEGVSSKIYFEALNLYLPDKLKFETRSQHPALDPMNALLNYGYGLLYGKIEAALIKAGIDPYVGVMHRDNYNRPVLVYDIIELYRIWVDYVVYSIAIQKVVTDEFYSVKEDGSYWLEALGKRVLIQSLNDYLSEVIEYKGMQRSRQTQIALYAQELAQTFKQFIS